jgi:hypothetical protein
MKTKEAKGVSTLLELEQIIIASFDEVENNSPLCTSELIKIILEKSCGDNIASQVGMIEDIKLEMWHDYYKDNDWL